MPQAEKISGRIVTEIKFFHITFFSKPLKNFSH